ncbi:terminase small subunit [Alloiococcus otitis]|uniref:terminase small subunit n=1 Tax=Alloiococcus otitis TaxID=1652 RepID=UPI00058DEA43|nr:terminase small subunit [Alloiococcus otitis]
MDKLNVRQRKFVDEYIIHGNATKAAINAGYSKKTAGAQAGRLLHNVKISQAIKRRTEQLFDEKAMSVAEAIALSSSIARGEPQTSHFKETDKQKDEVTKETERQYTPSVEDRQRSLEHILKIHGAFTDRSEIELTGGVQFIDDIDPEDE